MKLVKSDRTLMKEDALSNFLTIKCEGPSKQEFDPPNAINQWFNLKPHRRPGRGDSQENKASKNFHSYLKNSFLLYLVSIFCTLKFYNFLTC